MKNLLIFTLLIIGLCGSIKGQEFEWAQIYSSTSTISIDDIAEDSNGNIYTLGDFNEGGLTDFDAGEGTANYTNTGGFKVFITKRDASGNFIWLKLLESTETIHSSKIKIDNNDNLILLGYYKGTADFDPGSGVVNHTYLGSSESYFLLKLTSSGEFTWVKNFGVSRYVVSANDISIDNSGNVCTIGTFSSPFDFGFGLPTNVMNPVNTDTYILKLNAAGNFIWSKSLEVSSRNIAIDGANNIYISGGFRGTRDFDPGPGVVNMTSIYHLIYGDVYILKLNSAGEFIWSNQYGGSHAETIFSWTLNNNSIFLYIHIYDATIIPTPATFNLPDGYGIVKLTTSGTTVWSKSIENIFIKDMDTDGAGNLFFAGTFLNTADFNPNSGTYTITANNGSDAFICKWDSDGSFDWMNRLEGTDLEAENKTICVTTEGAVYAGGTLFGTADFDPGSETYNLTSVSQDGQTYKLRQSCVASPFSADDTIYQEVIENDPYCCSSEWDATCQTAYNAIEAQNCVESPYNYDDPIYLEVIQDDPFCCETSWDGLCQDAYDVYLDDCAASPYESNDPVYLQVIYEDPYCCNTSWDSSCENQYYNLSEGSSIEGSVTWSSTCGIRPAVLQLYNTGTTTLAHEYNTSIFVNGQFLVESGPLGTFDVFLKVNGYLKKSIGTQTIVANNQFSFYAITPGDLNNDNVINTLDFSIIAGAFNRSPGQPNYSALADINCDGNVNIIDISIMGPLFGLAGNSAPW